MAATTLACASEFYGKTVKKEDGSMSVAIVVGGFHAHSIARIFERKKVSWAIYQPEGVSDEGDGTDIDLVNRELYKRILSETEIGDA